MTVLSEKLTTAITAAVLHARAAKCNADALARRAVTPDIARRVAQIVDPLHGPARDAEVALERYMTSEDPTYAEQVVIASFRDLEKRANAAARITKALLELEQDVTGGARLDAEPAE